MIIHVLHVKNGHYTIIKHGSRMSLIDISKLSESEMALEREGKAREGKGFSKHVKRFPCWICVQGF